MTVDHPERHARGRARAWIPRQHGAWAMLLLPLLVGVAVSRPDPWQAVVGGAALTGYLASATVQAWARARRPPEYRAPILAYGASFLLLGLVLVASFPPLLLVLAVAIPAALVVFGGARPGTRRDLGNSLAQAIQALVLVPAAACVSGEFEIGRVLAGVAIAGAYLIGTVLVVRSVLRERGNARFAALSMGVHLAVAAVAILFLPAPYGLVGLALAARSIALPWLQRQWAGGAHALRPIHVGLVEIVASIAVVVVALAVPL